MRKLGIFVTSLFGVVLPLLFLSAFLAPSAFAACHAVAPSKSGTGDGSSWSNAVAYSSLADSRFVRGEVYYFADGDYGTSFSLTTGLSGTKTITIKKAQSYDYGRTADGCSNDISAGWNASTMGSGQALWHNTTSASGPFIYFGTAGGYYIINGNGRTADPAVGCGNVQSNPPASMTAAPNSPSDCGFKWDDSTCTSTATNGCDGGNGFIYGAGPGIQLLSIEIKGQGLNSKGNNSSETYGWFASGGNLTGVIIEHAYFHNMSTTDFTVVGGGWNGGKFDHNYSWGLFDGSINHGEAIQLQGSNGTTAVNNIDHNIFRDQQTNGDVVAVIEGTQTYNFYDNVDFCSSGGNSDSCRHNNGIIGCYNSQTCANVKVYNNTFSFPGNCGWNVTGGPSTMTVENNLWYNCASVGMAGGTNTVDYNSYLNSSQSAVGTHDVSISSGAANPFVNLAIGNVNLVSDGSNYNNRLSLASPYSVDLYGNSFTTNRGAAQSVSSIKPAAPTNLSGSVQ